MKSVWGVSFVSRNAPNDERNDLAILNNVSTHEGEAHCIPTQITLLCTLCWQSFQGLHDAALDRFLKRQKQMTFLEPFWRPIINFGDAVPDKADATNTKAWFPLT